MGKIKAIVKRTDEAVGHMTWISNTLENLQRTVGGYIEAVQLWNDIVVICDEEGRIKRKDANCVVKGIDFVGDIIVLGIDGDEFADVPISMREWRKMLGLSE